IRRLSSLKKARIESARGDRVELRTVETVVNPGTSRSPFDGLRTNGGLNRTFPEGRSEQVPMLVITSEAEQSRSMRLRRLSRAKRGSLRGRKAEAISSRLLRRTKRSSQRRRRRRFASASPRYACGSSQ